MDRTTIEFGGGNTTATLTLLSTTLKFEDTSFMPDVLELTAGDTHEPVRARLFGPDGDPADLSIDNLRITFILTDRDGEVVINSRASVDDDTDESGWVQYDWRRGETDTPGTYRARFRVRYPDGSILHYPNGRPAKVLIRRS